VADRFSQSGRTIDTASLWPLVYAADGHPQRLMLLAHRLWALTEPGHTADLSALRSGYEATMRQVDAEMRGLWDSLSPNERRVLLGVAAGLSPTESETVAMTGLRQRSSAQRAGEALVGRGVLEREDDDRYRIVDPLLQRWTLRRPGARPIAYVLPSPPGWLVTDGPSLVFEHSRHDTLDAAEQAAARIVSGRAGGDVVVHDTPAPNDLPDWAV
jgi:hypothetical protein